MHANKVDSGQGQREGLSCPSLLIAECDDLRTPKGRVAGVEAQAMGAIPMDLFHPPATEDVPATTTPGTGQDSRIAFAGLRHRLYRVGYAS